MWDSIRSKTLKRHYAYKLDWDIFECTTKLRFIGTRIKVMEGNKKPIPNSLNSKWWKNSQNSF